LDRFPKNKLKLLYIDILHGFTSINHAEHKILYLKHFNTFDIGDVDLKQEEYLQQAIKEGLPTKEERERYLIEEKFWSHDKNNLIIEYRAYIEGLKTTKSKLFREAEINEINKRILEYQKKITDLTDEKEELISFTAESFANKKVNEYYIFNSFYKDKEFKTRLFTIEEFDELEENDLANLASLYNQALHPFVDYNLKRIALSPFFFNTFCLCETAREFYGLPIIKLTFYQAELFGHGRYFRSLLQNTKGKPPENLMDEPDKLIEWHESSNTAQELANKKGIDVKEGASSLVGVSRADREKYGLDDGNPHEALIKAAQNKGGELNLHDIMRAMGK